jgi:hypothetical protein
LPELSHLSPILTASPGRNHFTEEHKAFVREKVDEGVSNSRTIHEALNLKFELVGPDTHSSCIDLGVIFLKKASKIIQSHVQFR